MYVRKASPVNVEGKPLSPSCSDQEYLPRYVIILSGYIYLDNHACSAEPILGAAILLYI